MDFQTSSALPTSPALHKHTTGIAAIPAPTHEISPVQIVAIREHFNIEDEPEPDYLKDALRIVRGQTMKRASKDHLSALIQDREELLLTLESATTIFEDFVKELEASFGKLPATRQQILALRKRIEIGRAL